MKRKMIKYELIGLLILLIFFAIVSRNKRDTTSPAQEEEMVEKPTAPKKHLSEDFKAYWYAGEAEITSYQLEQARYGELREGKAVLIYVTEPFLPKKQVKADQSHPDNIPVLKLNATKTFVTGIYPYSIMSSTFYPVHDYQHALKTSVSVQEWCGQVYAQINNRERFAFTSHSYFQDEADQQLSLEKNILENELWTKIRINPSDLPVGDLQVIPSLEYMRLQHKAPRAYKAQATLSTENGSCTYTLVYPELERSLAIRFSDTFPYAIEGWTEDFKSGRGTNAKKLRTQATRLKSLKTAYWQQNSNKDLGLRDSLGL